MKIAFWGGEMECGTTSNLMALGAYISSRGNCQVAMLQAEGKKQSIRNFFSGKPTEFVKEKSNYYALEGLDYLLSVGKRRPLDKQLVKRNLETLGEGLFCLTAGNRGLAELYPKETDGVLLQVIEQLEEVMDFTFIDCGRREDEWARELLRDADLVVVNLKQSTESFDRFFLHQVKLSKKCLYVIGNYQKESVYNRRNLERIYRIPENQLAVVPYNPEFQQALERGRLDKYMQGKGDFYVSETRKYFMQELEQILQRLMEETGYGK